MGRLQDQITLASLSAQGANFTGSAINVQGYVSGTFYFNCTTAGTTFAPSISGSFDGTNWLVLPTAILATPAAITAVGLTGYPLLGTPVGLPPLIRFNGAAFTGSFTGVCYGVLNHP